MSAHTFCVGCEEHWRSGVVPPRVGRIVVPITVEQTAFPLVVSGTARQEKHRRQPQRRHKPCFIKFIKSIKYAIFYVGGFSPYDPLLRVFKEWHGRAVPPRGGSSTVPGATEQAAGPPGASVPASEQNRVARGR